MMLGSPLSIYPVLGQLDFIVQNSLTNLLGPSPLEHHAQARG